jgi:hypothetical protein
LNFVDNWSITCLRPSNPLRPCFTYSANSQSSSHALKYELSTKKIQPTYEEDALVLRVIEAYSIAFQNTSRNTVHSGESSLMIFIMHFSLCAAPKNYKKSVRKSFLLSYYFFYSINHQIILNMKKNRN